jgi:glycine/D-amino acid oxidase-like deaminating enzyme
MTEPHWESTAPAAPAIPDLQADLDADVAVIGAGYTGLVAALTVAEAGARVAVLEAGEPGEAASGRNAGHVGPLFWGMKKTPADMLQRFGEERGARMHRLVAGSGAFLFDLIARHAILCEARRGSLCVARTDKTLAAMIATFEQWTPFGGSFEVLSAESVRTLIDSPRYAGGVRVTDGGFVNPLALTRGLVRAAKRLRVQLFARSRALSAAHDGEAWTVRTAEGSVRARTLLVGTGAYADSLFPALANEAYTAVSGMAATDPLPAEMRAAIPGGLPFVDLDDPAVFGPMIDDEGCLTVSFLADGDTVDLKMAERILRPRLRRALPALAEARFTKVWSGKLLLTPDGAPHLLELGPNAWAARGCNGFGHTLGISAARELAALALGAAPEDLAFPVAPPKPAPMPRFTEALVRRVIAPLANRFGA